MRLVRFFAVARLATVAQFIAVTQFIAVALFVLVMAGCSASNVAQLEQTGDGPHTVVHSHNSLLASRLHVRDIKTRHAGDLMVMQAMLENGWKFQSDFQYQVKWFDKDGFEIAPQSQPWQQLVMAGRSQTNIQAVAPNPTAVRFEIWVRE